MFFPILCDISLRRILHVVRAFWLSRTQKQGRRKRFGLQQPCSG
jgi:hypothetical protein